MKPKTSVYFCIILVLLFCGNSFAQTQNAEKAKELWEKVIEAKGGRENLYAVKTLAVSTKSYSPSDREEFRENNFEEFYILPDKFWWWMDGNAGFSLEIRQYDFSSGMGYEIHEGSQLSTNRRLSVSVSNANMSELKSDKRFNFIKQKFEEKQILYLMETSWLKPQVEEVSTIKKGSKKVEIIKVSYGKQKFEFSIDSETYLPSKVEIKTWIKSTKSFYEDALFLEDYVEINGVKFPQVIRRGKKIETKTSYQVNVKYDENLFNTLPTFKYGSEGWKPKVIE